ncbi:unnamed protein product [Phytophthora lilii]|uniref:Unnamed protein product n=1 Tax=Phytophthora lilii TaxID=2077276 RepID=A0A9W7D9P0_9STRA|nr:unnamed protein product [Phytophthora lilii]
MVVGRSRDSLIKCGETTRPLCCSRVVFSRQTMIVGVGGRLRSHCNFFALPHSVVISSRSPASKASALTLVVAATLAASVHGHGYMSVPKCEYTFVGDTTQFMATIEASSSGFSGSFRVSRRQYGRGLEASKYKSLKELIMDLGKVTSSDFTMECGYTNPDETPQPLPETYVEWAHGSGEGFTPSHEGPCEVWCDDVRVFQDNDCAANYPTAPAKVPYDHDACLGASRLTFYWLALHSSTWQVYTNCAALEKTTSTGATSKYAVGGSSSTKTTTSTDNSAATISSTEGSDSTSTTTTEAPTATQAPTTDAPAAQTTDAPTVTTAAPVTTTAPSTDAGKCNIRRRH